MFVNNETLLKKAWKRAVRSMLFSLLYIDERDYLHYSIHLIVTAYLSIASTNCSTSSAVSA